jgi:hypothetical protein
VAAESAARASVPNRIARRAVILFGVALAACANFGRPDRDAEIPPALADLGRAGFRFDADVRFVYEPVSVCDGLTCADLVVIDDRRTIRLAKPAFTSPSRLRATLLEIWPRYQKPRRSDVSDLAHAALLVVTDGARAGVTDPEVVSGARFYYRQLWNRMPPASRADLPAPDALPAYAP